MASLRKRKRIWYAQFYAGGRQCRVSLETDSKQVAKEKVRRLESSLARGGSSPFASRTPLADVVGGYVEQARMRLRPKSAQTIAYYLRDCFGPICPALRINRRKVGPASRRLKPDPKQGGKCGARPIVATCFEQISTADIATFITQQMQKRQLKPKTANRYREILVRLFNWAMEERGIRMSDGMNPAVGVQRYPDSAPQIVYLKAADVERQLNALEDHQQLQTMVAMLILAGLRREELLWLTLDDVDRDHGMIRVHAKTVDFETWQPKTRSNRAIPISSRLASYLEKYRPRLTPGRWFFPSPLGKRYDPDNFSSDLRVVNRLAKLSWGCLHYRHTFGSHLAQCGRSLFKIAKLMGNSPSIAERHYAHLCPAEMAEEVEFVGIEKRSAGSDPMRVAQ